MHKVSSPPFFKFLRQSYDTQRTCFYNCTIKTKKKTTWLINKVLAGVSSNTQEAFFQISVSSISTSAALKSRYFSTSPFLVYDLQAPGLLNRVPCFFVVIPRSEANYPPRCLRRPESVWKGCFMSRCLFRPLWFKAVRQTVTEMWFRLRLERGRRATLAKCCHSDQQPWSLEAN